MGSDLGRRATLASGSVPLRASGGRRVTIHLDRGASMATPGFRLRSSPDLTIVLEREPSEHGRHREVTIIRGAR